MCGEHAGVLYAVNPAVGSSPRVWGAPRTELGGKTNDRLIPTCVGSTPGPEDNSARCAAHPHVCGEHCLPPLSVSRTAGSSPRVWGALLLRCVPRGGVRLIPTCVGSTGAGEDGGHVEPAHPHVCGEHYLKPQARYHFLGSSPRVWGARR